MSTFGTSKRCSPTMGVGDIFPSINHGEFEIIGYSSSNNIKVRFLETNKIGYTTSGAIRKRMVRPYEQQPG